MKRYAYLLIITFGLLSNCNQKEPEPTRIVVDSTGINLGNINTFVDMKKGNLILDKVGEGNISYTATTLSIVGIKIILAELSPIFKKKGSIMNFKLSFLVIVPETLLNFTQLMRCSTSVPIALPA